MKRIEMKTCENCGNKFAVTKGGYFPDNNVCTEYLCPKCKAKKNVETIKKIFK